MSSKWRLPKELFVAEMNPRTDDQFFLANKTMEETYEAHDDDVVDVGIYELERVIRVSRRLVTTPAIGKKP